MATNGTIAAQPPATIRKGDRDPAPGGPISIVQDRLRRLALTQAAADGVFGTDMEAALRRFQWYLANRRWRLRVPRGGTVQVGLIEGYARNAAIAVSGAYDLATALELKIWVEQGLLPTGSLVRLPMARYTRIERAPTFRQLVYPGAVATEILVQDGFMGGIDALEAAGIEARCTLRLNQAFRVQGVAPGGAVVRPATRSQHLIGRAVDGNIVDGATVIPSALLRSARRPAAATAFIAAAKRSGLRWGGDFSDVDPPHFDDPIGADSEDYAMHFFFTQRAYADQHPVRAA